MRDREATSTPGAEATLPAVLDEIRLRWRQTVWLRVAARVLLLAAAGLLLLTLADRLAAPTTAVLAGVTVALIVLVAAAAGALAWPVRRGPSRTDIARLVEEQCPECEDRVVSVVAGGPSPLRPLLEADAARVVGGLDLDRIIPRSRVRAATRGALIGLAALLGAGAVSHESAIRGGRAVAFIAWPPAITVAVSPGDTRVAIGDPLTIRAHVAGVPRGIELAAPVLRAVPDREAREMTRRADGSFVLELASVAGSFTYRVTAGPASSAEHRVEALPRPRVTRVDVHYDYPAFTGLPARVVEDSGDVYAPAETEVRLRVHTDKPLAEAAFVRDAGDEPQAMQLAGAQVAETTFTLDRNGAYRVALTDRDGIASDSGTEYFLRLVDDRPPDVRIVRPEGDRTATRLEEITIEARADDDHGVDELELVYAVRGADERRVFLGPGRDDRPRTAVTGRYTLRLETLDVEPGDFVTYYARAVDVGHGKAPTEAQSDIFFLEVRPFGAEFAAAESQAMTMGGGGSFDDLAAAQKDLIIATWKVERRRGAGQSAEDIATLAEAQRELAGRVAEQAGAAMPRRPAGRGRLDDDAADEGGDAGSSPLARAAAEMTRAAAALDRQDTAGALPHEMEAYNELLRADAEARRRLVARQRGGGGGGGRTGTEDLSALFDRELLREQTTNYAQPETTASGSQEPESSSALDRLRELARRQDDLARAQRDLAREQGRLDEAEVKRRLERLTREQEELERQVARLAQELDQASDDRAAGEAADGRDSDAGTQASGRTNREADTEEARSDRAGREAGSAESGSGEPGATAGEQASGQRAANEAGTEGGAAAMGQSQGAGGGEEGQPREALERALAEMRRTMEDLQRAEVGEAASGSQESLARLREAERALDDRSARRDERTEELVRQLARAQEMRARLAEIDRQLAAAGQGSAEGGRSERAGETGEAGEGQPNEGQASEGQAGEGQAGEGQAAEGQNAGTHARDAGGADAPGEGGERGGADLEALGAERERLARDAESFMRDLERTQPGLLEGAARGGTPEHHEVARSAPGTEAFKQDFSSWDDLRQDIGPALELIEHSLLRTLTGRDAEDRLHAGGDERAPEGYSESVARYYRAIARKSGPGE